MSENPCVVSRHELAEGAKRHYEKVSMASCDWYSLIPRAIDAWEKLPELEARIAELEAAQRWKPVEPDSWTFHPYPCEVRYDAVGKPTHYRQSPPEDK